jgi:hypothetical protein
LFEAIASVVRSPTHFAGFLTALFALRSKIGRNSAARKGQQLGRPDLGPERDPGSMPGLTCQRCWQQFRGPARRRSQRAAWQEQSWVQGDRPPADNPRQSLDANGLRQCQVLAMPRLCGARKAIASLTPNALGHDRQLHRLYTCAAWRRGRVTSGTSQCSPLWRSSRPNGTKIHVRGARWRRVVAEEMTWRCLTSRGASRW